MKLLSTQLEQEINKQEENPFYPIAARKILENALLYQFRALADGLLSRMLLQGDKVGQDILWYQYVTRSDSTNTRLPKYNKLELAGFRKDLASRISTRQIKPLTISDLYDIQLRIYGGYVNLGDDSRINNQLSRLGSSYRIALMGSHQIIIEHLKSLLGETINKSNIDGRFIFGKIGHVNAYPSGILFDFETEEAVSPYLSMNAAAFNYEDKIVIRRNIINISVRGNLTLDNNSSIEEFEKRFSHKYLEILIHETAHRIDPSIGSTIGLNFSYSQTYRVDDTINDICRFTQHPRSIEEIKKAFYLNLQNPILGSEPMNSVPGENRYQLERLLKDMNNKGLVRIDEQGVVYCPIYEDGTRWIA